VQSKNKISEEIKMTTIRKIRTAKVRPVSKDFQTYTPEECAKFEKHFNTPHHHFESYAAGFSHEDGHWNRSQCRNCGITTDSYKHGDWDGKAQAEADLEKLYPNCE
jgi:hypothetical protein